jgi:hypothetical protein
VEKMAELKLNVLQALLLVTVAWNSVTSDALAHGFNKAGFGITDHNVIMLEDLTNEED